VPKENEPLARIKINRLLEDAGWRFEDSREGPANISLEAGVKYKDLGDDFENAVTRDGRRGSVDFLLLDKDKKPLVVVEAKRKDIEPLAAKEQARNYARNCGARFVILSNGNIHYFWDTKHGNPETITRFPTPDSITQFNVYEPNLDELAAINVDKNYILSSQMPNFAADPDFQDPNKIKQFLKRNNVIQMRPYGVEAVKSVQQSAISGNQRFLLEMATGTGKTLISAAIIKLFLKSGNARRVLFLVDRLELEEQARKAFVQYLGKDYQIAVYKDNRESWANAEVVVSTVQTFLAGDRYKKVFSPTDFEFVISDEAHRSIGGNSRAVFEYFVGFKLGLTATPKNYLKGINRDNKDDLRDYERRLLIDTYKTFGCEPGYPTFSYDLEKGSKEGYLIKPTLVDVRTEITTEILSDDGFAVRLMDETGQELERRFSEKDYERKLFNEETNIAMCKALLENGMYDPVSKELGQPLLGKTIVFAVSQKHAAKLTNIFNKLASQKWPTIYDKSDFAVQVTSNVAGAQQMTINFANNKLNGKSQHPEGYETSKTRIAVTVGMMTTGYDCQDLLNVALMRPVFSPTDFVQMKGRGTRKWSFEYDDYANTQLSIEKDKFKLFDFFATCEYFEEEFNYDEKINLPKPSTGIDVGGVDGGKSHIKSEVDLLTQDEVASLTESSEGVIMRIDKEGFKKALDEDVLGNTTLSALWQNGDRQGAEEYVKTHILDKPKNFLNLERIRKVFNVDRRISVKEFLEVAFGEKNGFEMKDELLESEWDKFMEVHSVDQPHYQPVKNFFKAFIVDIEVRDIVKSNELARFNTCATFDFEDYQKLNGFKNIVPQYINDYAYHLTGLNA
jgi:type I restriction enzyme R subunit